MSNKDIRWKDILLVVETYEKALTAPLRGIAKYKGIELKKQVERHQREAERLVEAIKWLME